MRVRVPSGNPGRGHRPDPRDRPRERLRRLGAVALADAELLALVLQTGGPRQDAWTLARLLLDRFDGLTGLAQALDCEIECVHGMGPAKTAGLVAAIELARRIGAPDLDLGEVLRGPDDVVAYFRPRLRTLDRECFQVLSLDGRHRLLAVERVSVGTLTASLVHPREVFRQAIRRAAAAILVVHNHPSGDPRPSAEDRGVTERLHAAGELLGIELLDHVIVARTGHYSFREAGDVLGGPGRRGRDPGVVSGGIGEGSPGFPRDEANDPLKCPPGNGR